MRFTEMQHSGSDPDPGTSAQAQVRRRGLAPQAADRTTGFLPTALPFGHGKPRRSGPQTRPRGSGRRIIPAEGRGAFLGGRKGVLRNARRARRGVGRDFDRDDCVMN
jgi:hypothetical protein